ncbi:B3/4 domain-containing protein [Companilactobacillus huachuanensis]|uniref:B3/4 domain-containing protein n=1 Tax=Companilactobacillus huachuanensis TaxID=2559914 RepID=A0ABW1RIT6_9LACO|nr:phenylalanine--tRNA ligase beta subunit-related protein [Companilactobacillus huachuanensis]
MQKIIIDQEFWDIFPEVEIAVMTAKGIDNHNDADVPDDLIRRANEVAKKWVPDDPISINPVVKAWRDAYRKFRTKKGARNAVENLLKRAKNDKGVGNINPIVDVYNSVSLEYAFPIAAEDLDKIIGDVHLTVAKGGETFTPIGEDEIEEALPGEVVYRDDKDVISRCWAWRDSARVADTDNTKNLLFYMENIQPDRKNDHLAAAEALKTRFHDYLNIDINDITILNKDNRDFVFVK